MIYFRLFFIFLTILLSGVSATGQHREEVPSPTDQGNLNQLDNRGRKHGIWLHTKKPAMGEPGINEFGKYEHGLKFGAWYKVDHSGDLVAIEHYRNDVLDGEVKYYDQGKLYCIGNYRGLNPRNKFDTIVITHPISHEEEYRVIPTIQGALRHGLWQYFDPGSGRLVKEEEYQVDELVYRKDYDISAKADSILRKKHEARMPHINSKGSAGEPPAGKKVSYTP